MTTRSVRIPDDIDKKFAAFAEARHISVNSAIVRVMEEAVARDAQQNAIARASDDVFARRGELFERLADA